MSLASLPEGTVYVAEGGSFRRGRDAASGSDDEDLAHTRALACEEKLWASGTWSPDRAVRDLRLQDVVVVLGSYPTFVRMADVVPTTNVADATYDRLQRIPRTIRIGPQRGYVVRPQRASSTYRAIACPRTASDSYRANRGVRRTTLTMIAVASCVRPHVGRTISCAPVFTLQESTKIDIAIGKDRASPADMARARNG